MEQNFSKKIITLLLSLTLVVGSVGVPTGDAYALSVPKFSGTAYCQVNNNKPKFSKEAKKNVLINSGHTFFV